MSRKLRYEKFILNGLEPKFKGTEGISGYLKGLQDAGVIESYSTAFYYRRGGSEGLGLVLHIELDLFDSSKKDRIDSTLRELYKLQMIHEPSSENIERHQSWRSKLPRIFH